MKLNEINNFFVTTYLSTMEPEQLTLSNNKFLSLNFGEKLNLWNLESNSIILELFSGLSFFSEDNIYFVNFCNEINIFNLINKKLTNFVFPKIEGIFRIKSFISRFKYYNGKPHDE